jgi:hypothetical protein
MNSTHAIDLHSEPLPRRWERLFSRLRRASILAACLSALLSVAAEAGASKAEGSRVRPAWPVVPSPNIGSGDNTLEGVTALSPTDAWAVGRFFDTASSQTKTLTQHWDGAAWTIVPSPNVGSGGISVLEAVDATSATDAWAVGHFTVEGSGEGTGRTLVERWDGSEWQVVPSPNAGLEEGGNGTLSGVLALAPDDVWAVGSHYPAVEFPTLQPLIEHWDGEEWEVVPGPSRSPGPWSELKAVSGSGPADIWAVGVRDARVGDVLTERALILHWDGEAWKRVRAPLPAARRTPFLLHDVVALSSTDAWAVGVVALRHSHRTLVMHWDGESWKVVRSANPSAQFQDLMGVAAVSPARVFAVGTYYDADADRMRTLVERWNGERWRTVTSGNRGNSELKDVAGVRGGQFAVGEFFGQEGTRTLVLQRRVPTG